MNPLLLKDNHNITITNESIAWLNQATPDEIAQTIHAITSVRVKKLIIKISLGPDTVTPNYKKLKNIIESYFLSTAILQFYNGDWGLQFQGMPCYMQLFYEKDNLSNTLAIEKMLSDILGESPNFHEKTYHFDELNDISVDSLLEIIAQTKCVNVQQLNFSACEFSALNEQNFNRVVTACKKKQWVHQSIVLFDLGLKKIFAGINYDRQQAVALAYLELLLPKQESKDNLTHPHLYVNQIPFDTAEHPDAFDKLVDNFLNNNPNADAKHVIELLSHTTTNVSKEKIHQQVLRVTISRGKIKDLDPSDLSFANTCNIISKAEMNYKTIEFLAQQYQFPDANTKALFLQAVNSKHANFWSDDPGNHDCAFGIFVTRQDIMDIANNASFKPLWHNLASWSLTYFHNRLIRAQQLSLLGKLNVPFHFDCSNLKLTTAEMVAISKKQKNLQWLAQGLLNSGLDKQQVLGIIAKVLPDFDRDDRREYPLQLGCLQLHREEIITFVNNNPSYSYVVEEWVHNQPLVIDQLTIDQRKELIMLRCKNSESYLSSDAWPKYKIPAEYLPEILLALAKARCAIDSELSKQVPWGIKYQIFLELIEHHEFLWGLPCFIENDDDTPTVIRDYANVLFDRQDYEEVLHEQETIEASYNVLQAKFEKMHNVFLRSLATNNDAQIQSALTRIRNKLFNVKLELKMLRPCLDNMFWITELYLRMLAEVDLPQLRDCFYKEPFVKTLEEIASLAAPQVREELTPHILSLIKDKTKFNAFCKMLESAARHKHIPILLIAANTQIPEDFKPVIDMIDSKYSDNKNLIILLNGFNKVFIAPEISDQHKLDIASKVLSYDISFKQVDSAIALQQLHHGYQTRGFNFNQMYITRETQSNTFGLVAYELNGTILSLENIGSDPRLNELNSLLQAWAVKDIAITRKTNMHIIKATISKTNLFACGVKSQLQALLMLQGLATTNILSKVGHDPKFWTSSWMSAYGLALQACFALPEQKLSEVHSTLATCRNKSAIIAYYSQLQKLKSEPYINLLKNYVNLIASSHAADFYQYRYDLAQQPQLQAVFGNNSSMLQAWRKGLFVNYNDFLAIIGSKENVNAIQSVDVKKYLLQKIYTFRHLSPEKYPFIHQFLATNSSAAKAQIYNDTSTKMQPYKNQDLSEDWRLRNQVSDLKMQILLMDYFNTDDNLDTQSKTKLLIPIKKLHGGHQFYMDMNNLIAQLLREWELQQEQVTHKTQPQAIKQKPIDTTGWQISDTDNFWDMLLIGTEVLGSCQNVNGSPNLNRCLIGGYVLSGHIRQIAIQNAEREIIARSVFRVMRDAVTKEPVVFLEKVYPDFCEPRYKHAIAEFALCRSTQLGCSLASKESDSSHDIYTNPLEVIAVQQSEYVDAIGTAQREGYSIADAQMLFNFPLAKSKMQKELTNAGLAMGRAEYGPRPLAAIQDLVFMYCNYLREVKATDSSAARQKFSQTLNLRLLT